MAQEIFTDSVLIDGSQDTTQLEVQGHSTQTEALQTWKDSSGTTLAEVLGDGRIHVGEDLGAETDDALIEVHRDSSSLRPRRGLGTLGKIGGTLDSIVQWIAHELRLTGSGDVDAQHSALRVQLTNESTGAITANGELRAGDFEVVNENGSTPQAGKAVGVRAAVHNTADGIVEQAIGIEVDVQDENVTTPVDTLIGIKINDVGSDNIALQTGTGKVGIGTDNPQSELDVNGDVTVSGTLSAQMFAEAAEAAIRLLVWDVGDYKVSARKTDITNIWLRCDGRTIGNASSGGTARADADMEALFTHLWDNFANNELPVSGGRGASAAADWSADKTIVLPDLRGRTMAMLDDPTGSSAANRITAAWADLMGGAGGAENHTLTVNEMPSHTHVQNAHTHIQNSHAHTQQEHNHGLGGHTHTIAPHTHTQNSHTHTQQAHNHSITPNPHTHAYGASQTAGGLLNGAYQWQQDSFATLNTTSASLSIGNATPTINAATAVNQSTALTTNAASGNTGNATPTINAATAVNQNATATNQNTGGGAAHNNIQPSYAGGIYLIYTGN